MRADNDLLRHAEALTPSKAGRAALALVLAAVGLLIAAALFGNP